MKVRMIQDYIKSYAFLRHMFRLNIEPRRLKVVILTSYKKCPPCYIKFPKKFSM